MKRTKPNKYFFNPKNSEIKAPTFHSSLLMFPGIKVVISRPCTPTKSNHK